MKNFINLSEAEVLKTFKSQRSYYVLADKIVFQKVLCIQNYELLFENNRQIFTKGQSYALWIAQVQNKSTGAMFYFVTRPKMIDDGDADFYIVPQDVFGYINLTIEPIITVIEKMPYQLVVSPSGQQLLIPVWRLNRDLVENYIAATDKDAPLKYKLVPRFLGKSLNDMFPAWEIKKIFDGRNESFYFNVFTGEIKSDWQEQKVFISIGSNQKNMLLGALSIAYRKKKMVIKF